MSEERGGQGRAGVSGPQPPALEMLHGKTWTSWNKTNPDLQGSQTWKSQYFSYAEGTIIVVENLLNLKKNRTQRGGKLGHCEGTPTTARALV